MSDEIKRINKTLRELENRISELESDRNAGMRDRETIARNQAGFNGDIKRMDKVLGRITPLVDDNAKNINNVWNTSKGNHDHLSRLVDRIQQNVDISDRNLAKTKNEIKRLDGRIDKLGKTNTESEIKRLDARIDKLTKEMAKNAKGRR